MYSDEHIDALVECAEKSHIRPGVKIQDTAFISNIYKRYKEINELFFRKESTDGGSKEK